MRFIRKFIQISFHFSQLSSILILHRKISSSYDLEFVAASTRKDRDSTHDVSYEAGSCQHTIAFFLSNRYLALEFFYEYLRG